MILSFIGDLFEEGGGGPSSPSLVDVGVPVCPSTQRMARWMGGGDGGGKFGKAGPGTRITFWMGWARNGGKGRKAGGAGWSLRGSASELRLCRSPCSFLVQSGEKSDDTSPARSISRRLSLPFPIVLIATLQVLASPVLMKCTTGFAASSESRTFKFLILALIWTADLARM